MDGFSISKEKRRFIIEEIIRFFSNERDEEIGVIAAESILEFFLRTMGDELYNKGVKDSKNLIKDLSDNLELNLDALIKK